MVKCGMKNEYRNAGVLEMYGGVRNGVFAPHETSFAGAPIFRPQCAVSRKSYIL